MLMFDFANLLCTGPRGNIAVLIYQYLAIYHSFHENITPLRSLSADWSANAAATSIAPLDSSTASIAFISVNGPLSESESIQNSVCCFTYRYFNLTYLSASLSVSLPSSVVSFMFSLLRGMWARCN